MPAPGEPPERQVEALEHPLDRLEVELGRQVHHREVFLVEPADRVGALGVAVDDVMEQVHECLGMAVQIHAHESGDLQEARIHAPHRTGMTPRHGADQRALEPLDAAVVASSLTSVGLTRVSIGPAISVNVRGCAGSPSSAISAVAASAATVG